LSRVISCPIFRGVSKYKRGKRIMRKVDSLSIEAQIIGYFGVQSFSFDRYQITYCQS